MTIEEAIKIAQLCTWSVGCNHVDTIRATLQLTFPEYDWYVDEYNLYRDSIKVRARENA